MRIEVSTRTPVHVGTGNVYLPAEYVKMRGEGNEQVLWRVSLPSLLRDAGPDVAEKFAQEIESREDPSKFSLGKFIKDHHLDLRPHLLYRVTNRSGEENPGEVRECAKTGGVPCIPGSSLKGAIRTALLWWHAREDQDFPAAIRREFERAERCDPKKIGMEYVASVFALKKPERGRYNAQYDLLRFLQVSDCMPGNYRLTCEGIKTYSLHGDRLEEKNYTIYAECVSGTFSGSIGGLGTIGALLEKGDDLPFLPEKSRRLLGVSPSGETRDVPRHLGRVLTMWSQWCLGKEVALARRDSDGAFADVLSQVQSWLSEGPLVRLGFASGTLYQTLIGLVEEKDRDLAENIITKCRLRRGVTRKATASGLEPPYPKSLEFSVTGQPLGWASLALEGG
ncbi:MAG: type III-A CRISPR-associated RAMP protein Csm5 [Methanolinea sp.]|nr:type III-A CRISPR-associated RAMP protein Csm5 [Methanolinea sp.]